MRDILDKVFEIAGVDEKDVPPLTSVRKESIVLPDGGEGEPEGVTSRPSDLIAHASLEIVCKDIADLLVKHFPGFLWGVAPDQRGGLINIFCLNFSSRWGYTVYIDHIQDDPRRRVVLRAGDEILRRFRYPLNRYDSEAMQTIKRDVHGEAIPDTSGLPKSKQNMQAMIDLAIADGRAVFSQDDDGNEIVGVMQ